MVYTITGVPVGAYQLNRLSALGIGHWAVDGGVGYTYLNETAGIEGSVVLGLTYNFINPDTQYQNGTDDHLLIFDKHSNIRMEDRLVSRRRRREVCGAAFA